MRVGLVLGAGGVMGGAWLTGGLDALGARDRLGPRRGRLRRRHLRRVDDRRAVRQRGPALVHGRPLDGRELRRCRGRPRPPGRRRPTAQPARCSGSGTGRRSAPGRGRLALRTPAQPDALPARDGDERLAAARAWSRPSRCRRRSAASCPTAGARTRASGSWRATTRPAGAWRSAARTLRRPTSPTRSPPRARSRASTGR